MIRRSPFALAAILLACASSAQITKVGDAYQMRLKFVKGQTMTYAMESTTSAPGQQQPMVLNTTFSMKVSNVRNGVADIKYSVGPMTMNGRQTGGVNTVDMRMDSRGKVLGGNPGAAQQTQMVLPDRPIRIGQTWTSTSNIASMGVPMQVTNTYKLNRIVRQGGKQLAEVSVQISAKGNISSSGNGTMLLDFADGSLVSATMNQTITIQQQGGQGSQPMKVSNKTTIRRKN
ncbi:MAG: DUF6263 family protein [Fimbriimonadales bacterium]|nr:DUF6263 family protein [Fimbriimonadales bacterium]